MKARTVQAIFRRVVKAGWYGNPSLNYNSEFMCHALLRAVQDDVITQHECDIAKAAIDEYISSLGDTDIMSWALYHAGHIPKGSCRDWSQNEGKEFYRNWNKRPKGILK